MNNDKKKQLICFVKKNVSNINNDTQYKSIPEEYKIKIYAEVIVNNTQYTSFNDKKNIQGITHTFKTKLSSQLDNLDNNYIILFDKNIYEIISIKQTIFKEKEFYCSLKNNDKFFNHIKKDIKW